MTENEYNQHQKNTELLSFYIKLVGYYLLLNTEAPYKKFLEDGLKISGYNFNNGLDALIDSGFAKYDPETESYKLTDVGTLYFKDPKNIGFDKLPPQKHGPDDGDLLG